MRKVFLTVVCLVFISATLPAVAGQTSGGNGTVNNNSSSVVNTWNFTEDRITRNISVGTSTSFDLGINASGNTSQSVNVETTGNISSFVFSIQSPVSTIPGQNVSVLNQVVVDRDQTFGVFNGSIVGTGDGKSESVGVGVRVFDDIRPELVSLDVGSVQSLTSESFGVVARDNLNVSTVSADILQVVEEEQGNETVKLNETFKEDVGFSRTGGDSFEYEFGDTDEIGQYYVNVTVRDSSGNTVSRVKGFKVVGLDSIQVLSNNFVFDTIRPKSTTKFDIVKSELDGKKVVFELENLSYGGNKTVEVGVVPPGSDATESLNKGDRRSYTEKGVYQVSLSHKGDNETLGEHRVDGELLIRKPGQHVPPVNESVVFDGLVKNNDKPPEDCTLVGEFSACIGYSFDSTLSLFEEEYGGIRRSGGNGSYVYKVSRLPVSQVEGSSEWRDSTSFTMGEYNESLGKALEDAETAKSKVHNLVTFKNLPPIGYKWQRNLAVFLLVFLSLSSYLDKLNSFVAFKGVKKSDFKEHYTMEEFQEEVDESYVG